MKLLNLVSDLRNELIKVKKESIVGKARLKEELNAKFNNTFDELERQHDKDINKLVYRHEEDEATSKKRRRPMDNPEKKSVDMEIEFLKEELDGAEEELSEAREVIETQNKELEMQRIRINELAFGHFKDEATRKNEQQAMNDLEQKRVDFMEIQNLKEELLEAKELIETQKKELEMQKTRINELQFALPYKNKEVINFASQTENTDDFDEWGFTFSRFSEFSSIAECKTPNSLKSVENRKVEKKKLFDILEGSSDDDCEDSVENDKTFIESNDGISIENNEEFIENEKLCASGDSKLLKDKNDILSISINDALRNLDLDIADIDETSDF